MLHILNTFLRLQISGHRNRNRRLNTGTDIFDDLVDGSIFAPQVAKNIVSYTYPIPRKHGDTTTERPEFTRATPFLPVSTKSLGWIKVGEGRLPSSEETPPKFAPLLKRFCDYNKKENRSEGTNDLLPRVTKI